MFVTPAENLQTSGIVEPELRDSEIGESDDNSFVWFQSLLS